MPTAYDFLLLDWGIGGLSVHQEAARLYPNANILYISDSGFLPYGKVAPNALEDRLEQLLSMAEEKFGVQRAVLACNAASTALENLQKRLPKMQLSGMIVPGRDIVRISGHSQVGVIGGNRTIDSGLFHRELKAIGIEARERSAQPLSALIERGIINGPEMREALTPILAPLQGVPALLLACTHYPAATAAIAELLPNTQILDPGKLAAAQIGQIPPRAHPGFTKFLTTGNPKNSSQASALAFGVEAAFGPLEIPC